MSTPEWCCCFTTYIRRSASASNCSSTVVLTLTRGTPQLCHETDNRGHRDENEGREEILEAVRAGRFTVDVLYGDYEGGQRVVSRFGVFREGDAWTLSVVRHWQIDRPNPR